MTAQSVRSCLGLFLVGSLVPVALACGGSTTTPVPGDDASFEAGSGSSSGGSGSGSSSGSSSGGADSGSSSGGRDSGSSSGSGGGDAGCSAATTDAGAPLCGTMPCDLRTHTCCVGQGATGTCLSGNNATCTGLTAAFHCQFEGDCTTSGQVCCGLATQFSASTACQTVAQGASCKPAGTSAQGSAQLCKCDAECKNGQPCIAQACAGGSNLSLCGLQSAPPYNCTKR